MNIKSFIKNNGEYLFGLSIVKTLRFNIKYFGWKGFSCPIWLNRSVRIRNTKGHISVKKYQSGIVKMGWSMMENHPRKTIWNVQGGEITFTGYAALGAGTQVISRGELIFGDGFAITGNTDIICYKKVQFGNEVLISWDCLLMDHDYHTLTDHEGKINEDEPIIIGDHVWIGARNVILHGAELGNDCVVAANSTVTHKFERENVLIVGNKILKDNIRWSI